MNTEYEALNLDDILELTRSDAEHAGDMAEQARVLREMSGKLQDNVDLMRDSMRMLFGSEGDPKAADAPDSEAALWKGDSAKKMWVEMNRLFKTASTAPEVLKTNATSMDDFSSKVTETLITIDQLHVKSKGHGADSGAEDSDIKQARQILQTATSGYLSSANEMPEPEFYNGLRKSADDESDGGWTESHGATPTAAPPETGRPAWSEPGQPPPTSDPGSTTNPTNPTYPTDPADPPRPTGPELQNPPAPTAPAPTPVAPPVGGPPVAPPVGVPPVVPPPMGGPGPWMPPRPTVPPVIGGPNRPPANPTPVPRPIAPNPGGTVRPVIGTRPTVPPPTTRPITPNPGGTVRPVIGSRPPITPPVTRPIAPNPGGTVRPVIGTRPGPGVFPPTSRPLNPTGQVGPIAGPRSGPGVFPPTGRTGSPNPNGTVRPVIGSRPGPGVVPPVNRPVTGSRPGGQPPIGTRGGGVHPFGATGRPVSPGSVPAGGKAPVSLRPNGTPGQTPFESSRYINARPAGGLAFGNASTPAPSQSAPARNVAFGQSTDQQRETRSGSANPPGQRHKRIPRQGGSAVERGIKRGARIKQSRSPGQEVFAKFDAAKASPDTAKAGSARQADTEPEWEIRRVTVPAVITTRKAS